MKQIDVAEVSRFLGMAGRTRDDWVDIVSELLVRLTVQERAALAFMALTSLDLETAFLTADTALHRGAGAPLAPLFSFMDEAAFWADMAEPEELEAYCLASFNRMATGRQAAFLDYVNGRTAAQCAISRT